MSIEGVPPQLISLIFGLLGAVGGVVVTSLKIRSDFFKEVKEFYDREIKNVRDNVDSLHKDIAILESRLEKKIERDIAIMKESNDSEIKNLRHTVVELKEEVRSSHANLIALLTKLINN